MAIVVTELPYQVNKAALLEKIADLVKDKKIEGIADLRDESDRDGMRMVIEFKRDANPHKVLNNLFKHTALQLGLQHEHAGAGRRPAPDAAAEVGPPAPRRRTAARSSAAGPSSTSARRATGPTSSRASRSRSTTSTRSSRPSASRPTPRRAQTNLMARFDLSELQAQAILEMQLARLAALERKKIEDEYLAVIQLIAELEDILANPARVLPIIKDELARAEAQVRRRAADARRRTTRVARADRRGPDRRRGRRRHGLRPRLHQAPAAGHLPAPAPRRQGHHRPRDPRGGRGRAPARRQHARLGAVLHQPRPRLQRRRSTPIPDASRQAKGMPIINLEGVQVEAGEVPSATITLPDFERATTWSWPPGAASSRRRRSSSSSASARPGIRAITVDEDDELAWVGVSSGEDDVIIATAQGMLARFNESEVRPMGRDAGGVIGIRLPKQEGDEVVAMSVVQPGADLLVLTETGYGKRVALDRVPAQAPRRPGRPADRARGPQDGPRGRRRAGHRDRRGAAPDLRRARSCGPTSRPSTATRRRRAA